jgi:hypothetical protein
VLGPPDYVEDTRYSRRVRLNFNFAGGGNAASVTFGDLLIAVGLPVTSFTRLQLTRIDAWGLSHTTSNGTSLAPVVRITPNFPVASASVIADRTFQDEGIAGAVAAHVAIVPHGSIVPFNGTATVVAVVNNPIAGESPSNDARVLVDFMVSFYDTVVQTVANVQPDGSIRVGSFCPTPTESLPDSLVVTTQLPGSQPGHTVD